MRSLYGAIGMLHLLLKIWLPMCNVKPVRSTWLLVLQVYVGVGVFAYVGV